MYRENTDPVKKHRLLIPEGSDWQDVMQLLRDDSAVLNLNTLNRVAEWSGYGDMVKPGYYRITPGMNNLELLRMLASGRQTEIRLVLRGRWSKERLIGYVSSEITADSMTLVQLLNDSTALSRLGWTPETVLALFIPNTYNFWWTTSADQFMERMQREYDRYWNTERKQQAQAVGLTPLEVSILASVVDKETSKADEMPTIAGVYLNRLKKGMKLEADPTVIFAVGNPDIRRVTYAMTEIESPYNTYYVTGLPPGPICMPSVQAIEAVLNPDKHNYLYFCAKEDFSGYHNFTHDYNQHLVNSRKYRLELNKRGIR